MKKLIVIFLAILIFTPSYPKLLEADYKTQQNKIDNGIKRILKDLRKCESGDNDNAINEIDLDFTASFGRYQFKPQTLYNFATKYKILPDIEPQEIMNVIMDGELQEKVLIEMIKEYGKSKKFWEQQFPGCNRKYNFYKYL